MVPGVIEYIPEYRGVTGTPRRLLGLMGPIGGRGDAAKGQPRAPPPKCELDKEGGGAPPFLSPSLVPSPLLVQLGVLPSSRSRRQGRGRGKRRKEGAPPLLLVQFGLGLGGARPALGSPSLFP